MLKTKPAVFAVGNEYQIMVPVTCPSLFWVKIGDKCFYDEQNGIMRSITTVHRVCVPMEILDNAGGYTVCEKEIIERKPYFPTTKETVETAFDFYPVTDKKSIKAYHIADAHSLVDPVVAAAKVYGDFDFVIMNGDIPNHCGELDFLLTVYEIADKVTGGEKPIVFARGNHDLRGFYAEKMAEYTPSQNLNTYYTFRLGPIWGIVLDCGEDKEDSHEEYGFTVACHPFRVRQTDFIKKVIENRKDEYEADGVKLKLIISHNPFTYLQEPPFDIEKEIFGEWAKLLKENVKPDLMISGHVHGVFFKNPGDDFDHLGQPCPLLIASDVKRAENYYVGAGIEFCENETNVTVTNSEGKTLQRRKI